MNKKIILFLILLLLFTILLIDYGYLQEKEEEEGPIAFITGNKYLEMPDSSLRMLYVYGLSDMYSYVLFQEYPETYSAFIGKFRHMTIQQITALFDKYLEEHPEQWHFAAANIFDEAMTEIIEAEGN